VIRRRVVVQGRVQGVFFRNSCRRQASTQGVNGWVRNRSDGAVEAVFEGEPPDVDAMIEWMREGPPTAQVQDVSVYDEQPEDVAGFRVR
jgi:acylphosphatase